MSFAATAKSTLRRTWPVLLAYALFSMWGLGCVVAAIFLNVGQLAGGIPAMTLLVGTLVAVLTGHVFGNLLGLAGFRLGLVIAVFVGLVILASTVGVGLGPLLMFVFIGIFAAFGGYLGIGSRLDVVAAWYPLTLCTGAAIFWMNVHGAIHTFNSGAKHRLWDPFTIVCLAGGVFFMLVFLATRNSLGLTVWQEVARPRSVNASDVVVARPGRGSFLVLMAFTVAVLGVTALVSPYLFRTAPAESKEAAAQPEARKPGDFRGVKTKGHGRTNGKPQDEDDQNGEPDNGNASEAIRDAALLAAKILEYVLILAAILLFLYLVLWPPIRRAFLMRHLERPLWPVAPTARVMNHWRRALAVLAMAGIEPAAGETATDFSARAAAELGGDAPGLAEAAAVVEKIAYAGRGLGAEDEVRVREATTRFVDAVTPRIKLSRRLAASWGRPPQIET